MYFFYGLWKVFSCGLNSAQDLEYLEYFLSVLPGLETLPDFPTSKDLQYFGGLYYQLCTSHKDHVTIEEVHAKTQEAIRPHEDLLTTVECSVKRHKLQWYETYLPSHQVWPKPSCKAQKGGRR